jgi:hypothetical protein
MGQRRLEIIGNLGKSEVHWLRNLGCFTEVIAWKMRVFVPTSDQGLTIIEKICRA